MQSQVEVNKNQKTHVETNYMELSLSWDAHNHSANKEFPALYGSKGSKSSFPCWEAPNTGPYSEPHESRLQFHILFL
jgi:hypothetical protein